MGHRHTHAHTHTLVLEKKIMFSFSLFSSFSFFLFLLFFPCIISLDQETEEGYQREGRQTRGHSPRNPAHRMAHPSANHGSQDAGIKSSLESISSTERGQLLIKLS
ncbi:hypothetical protein BDV27DRAFT_76448 [Aspergillus caelatus]|uniref:Uncharacterized protein n=2 Tax=Aspergillus subgen. Circumdati TaxID=2720871 RepID=A0A5N6ZK07_9EURO|nr:uncharacterized protein BDV27DRAFT_76448 [Aspergillus caelatus]KAE8357961.1 hypothetical protein BDV27DRAFT_76448 [Aspergillus caelatus]KAE8414788.1 hypothetical protein BDV36DRAFT_236728 [Aspergillus pseudocaelatus]